MGERETDKIGGKEPEGEVSLKRDGEGVTVATLGGRLWLGENVGEKVGERVGFKRTSLGKTITYDTLSIAHPPYSVTITSP